MDYNSSVVCNAIGYSDTPTATESSVPPTIHEEESSDAKQPAPKKSTPKIRYQHRQFVHQWICIRDIVDGLITCNHTLKTKSIPDILTKMDLWVEQRSKSKIIPVDRRQSDSLATANVNQKLFKTRARQLVWDLMEMK